MKIFLSCQQVYAKSAPNDGRMRVIYRGRGARRLHFDQVLNPPDSPFIHFHQVPDPSDQVTVFGISHTDGKFFFHASRCMRNRHSTMIVGLIESDVRNENEVCKACFEII
jgi:hypothetical protein